MQTMREAVQGREAMNAHRHPVRDEVRSDSRLTASGTALVACQCAGLVVVFAALKWRPDSDLGAALSTPAGLAVVALLLSGGLSLAGPVLGMLGLPIVERTTQDR